MILVTQVVDNKDHLCYHYNCAEKHILKLNFFFKGKQNGKRHF